MSTQETGKTSLLNVRLTPETKRLWSEAAEVEGLSLSEAVREVVTDWALAQTKIGEATDEEREGIEVALGEEAELVEEGEEQPAAAKKEAVGEAGVPGTSGAIGLSKEEMEAAAQAQRAMEEMEEERMAQEREPWAGVLGTIGSPTSDNRYLVPDEIEHRDLPLPFSVQPALAEGHEGAINAGRIEEIEYVPFSDFERKEEFYSADQIDAMPEHAVVIFGHGTVDGSPAAKEAKRQIENGADVSLDGLRFNGKLYNPETFEEVDTAELEMGELFQAMMEGIYLQGVSGKIGGVTVVSIGAFEEARVIVTASGSLSFAAEVNSGEKERFAALVATAGPLKPLREWLEDPQLRELTSLQITKEGRVFGHLADWNGCHTGFQGVCVPPFYSLSNYAYFNVGEIETAEGDLVPCGKLMFAMDGAGHAPTDARLSYIDVQRYYDDATKVGAFVRAGADRFGTWLAGALRPGLSEIEVQHLRTHPPSGDWRPIRGGDQDLIAAFSVPIPGFPIPRGEALVASAGGEITVIITAPLEISEEQRERRQRRQQRIKDAMGMVDKTKAEIRHEIAERLAYGPWHDGLEENLAITAEQRRRWARSGVALPDGSFPITSCTGGPGEPTAENAIRARGRSGPPPERKAQIERHIRKSVRRLGGCSDSDIVKNFMEGEN